MTVWIIYESSQGKLGRSLRAKSQLVNEIGPSLHSGCPGAAEGHTAIRGRVFSIQVAKSQLSPPRPCWVLSHTCCWLPYSIQFLGFLEPGHTNDRGLTLGCSQWLGATIAPRGRD